MSGTKKRFKTIIQGKTYVILGTKPQTHMKAVTELVEEQLNQLKELTTGLDGERRAILLAINAVSTQMDLQERVDKAQEKMDMLEEKNRQLEERAKFVQDSARTPSDSEDV